MIRVALVLACTLLTSGCGDSSPTGPASPDIEGTWEGQILIESEVFGPAVRLYLSGAGDGSPVTGSAELTPAGEVSVSGHYEYPVVILTLNGGSQEALHFAGQFIGENSIIGSLTWRGHYDVADLTLQRRLDLGR